MYNFIIVILCLFSPFYSAMLPFKKNSDFGDELCAYRPHGIYYVKDCKDNKYCKFDEDEDLGFCRDPPSEITLLSIESSECSSDFECESNLVCKNKKCTFDCSTGESSYKTNDGNYKCRNNNYKDIFYFKNFKWETNHVNGAIVTYPPDFLKVGGIISFNVTSTSDGKVYEAEEIKNAYVGTVNDGDFVFDEKACKSGFALYFYGDGNLNKPYTGTRHTNYMFKKCVTLQDIDKSSSNYCKIKYSIGENGDIKTYDVNELSDKITITEYQSYYDQSNGGYVSGYYHPIDNSNNNDNGLEKLCNSNIKTKLEIFKKYIEIFTEDFQSKCTKSEKIDNDYLETCGDNKLRKWSYLYANPSQYEIYYDEDKDEDGNEVINYLVQQAYPSYQSSGFLNIHYFICLLLLSFL